MLNLDSIRTYWNKELVEKTYHDLCILNGNNPIIMEKLIEMGYYDLVNAFNRHYNKTELDKSLGYETNENWSAEIVKERYENLCVKFGNRSLKMEELALIGESKLIAAISVYWGGKNNLDKHLGYKTVGYYYLENGVVLRSLYEVIFANFLLHNNVDFLNEKKIDDNLNYRYDFKIKDLSGDCCYVEIWGYVGANHKNTRVTYEEVKNKKIQIYKKLNKKLIEFDFKFFKERNLEKLQYDLKDVLISNNIKIDNFKILSIDDIIKSYNTKKWNKEKAKELYQKLCKENGNMPLKRADFDKLERSDLLHAIYDFWGGKNNLDIELGYKLFYALDWTKEKVIEKYREACLENGNLPVPGKKLKELGYIGLDSAITNHFGSKNILDKMLNYTPLKLSSSPWTKEKIFETYKKICLENGDNPIGIERLEKMGYGGMIAKIYHFFGRKIDLDILLNYNPLYEKNNHTKEYVLETYNRLYIENGNIPIKYSEFKKLGHVSLKIGIAKHFGTKTNLEKELNITSHFKEWNKEITLEEYRKLCIKNGNRPITNKELKDCGNGPLIKSINRYFKNKTNIDMELGYIKI